MHNRLKKHETNQVNNDGAATREEEITRLMQTHKLNRQQAEYVLGRKNAPLVPRHVMERLTREEYNEFLEEMARSGEDVFTLGSYSRKDEPDDEEVQIT